MISIRGTTNLITGRSRRMRDGWLPYNTQIVPPLPDFKSYAPKILFTFSCLQKARASDLRKICQ